MGGNDPFVSHMKSQQGNGTMKSVEAALITVERAQKLDLLIHLISNLRQSLIICGPEGIGKTTLLSELKQRKNDVWPVLTIKASPDLSFESIQMQIINFVMQNGGSFSNQEFSSILSALDKQNQKIVILFESAGQLVPGLISTIIQYASISQSLRLVFSLTHDEVHLKNSSDQAIDDCHFIEMPPLSETQCGLFLQYLSRQPNAIVAYDAINERMIAKLYQKTHGIPGKIMSELPSLSSYNGGSRFKWSTIVFLALIVTACIAYFITDENKDKTENSRSLVLPNPEVVEISVPIVIKQAEVEKEEPSLAKEQSEKKVEYNTVSTSSAPARSTPSTEKKIDVLLDKKNEVDESIFNKPLVQKRILKDEIKKVAAKKEVISIKKPLESKIMEPVKKIEIAKAPSLTANKTRVKKEIKQVVESTVVKEKTVVKAKKVVKVKPLKNKSIVSRSIKDDSQWVLAQTGKSYTIQLIALSTHKAVIEFAKKNVSLKNQLRYFRKSQQGKTVFILIYGLFENSEAASKKMESLPVKYRKSWVRRFEILQKSIKK